TVNVQTGTLRFLGASSSSTGTLSAASGATLQFSNNFALSSGASVSSSGTALFDGGTVNVAVPYGIATTTVNGGTVNFNPATTLPALNMTNGTLGGTAAVNVTNPFTWAGGTFAGTGSPAPIISADTGATISGATTNILLSGRDLTLGGTSSTWSGGTIFIDA